LEAEAELFEAVHLGGIVKLSHGEGLRVEDDWCEWRMAGEGVDGNEEGVERKYRERVSNQGPYI
jgi:hypothetical protein